MKPDSASRVSRWDRIRDQLRAEGPAACRILVTVVAAWTAAKWVGADQPPVYAAIVPLVALRGDPMSALQISYERVLAVVAGVAIGIATLNVLRPSTASLVVVVALGLAVGIFFPKGAGLNVQVPASSLLVLANPAPDAYALSRFWETAMGALVTTALAPLLWPPHPRRVLKALADDARNRLAQGVTVTPAVLTGGPAVARDNLAVVNGHIAAVKADATRAREAQRAMRFNPLRRGHRGAVAGLVRAIETAERIAADLGTLAREAAAFSDRPDLVADVRRAQRQLRPVADATARAIDALLSEQEFRPFVTEARAALAAYAHSDSRPAAVALRRPFQQILDDLDPTTPLGAPSGSGGG